MTITQSANDLADLFLSMDDPDTLFYWACPYCEGRGLDYTTGYGRPCWKCRGQGGHETTLRRIRNDAIAREASYRESAARSAESDKVLKAKLKAQREARQAHQVPGSDIPLGRHEVTGTVAGFKATESAYGVVTKVLIDCGTYRLWGTLPKALADCRKGDRVSFTATLTHSEDDPEFGFFARPTKARII